MSADVVDVVGHGVILHRGDWHGRVRGRDGTGRWVVHRCGPGGVEDRPKDIEALPADDAWMAHWLKLLDAMRGRATLEKR